MKKINMLLLVVLVVLVSFNVNAELVEQDFICPDGTQCCGAITFDTDTGLTWLDVCETQGKSFNQVSADLVKGGKYYGYRLATSSEVEEYFNHGGVDCYNKWVDPVPDSIFSFFDIAGCTKDYFIQGMMDSGTELTVGLLEVLDPFGYLAHLTYNTLEPDESLWYVGCFLVSDDSQLGLTIDTDNDGIIDSLDNCPDYGSVVFDMDHDGCVSVAEISYYIEFFIVSDLMKVFNSTSWCKGSRKLKIRVRSAVYKLVGHKYGHSSSNAVQQLNKNHLEKASKYVRKAIKKLDKVSGENSIVLSNNLLLLEALDLLKQQ